MSIQSEISRLQTAKSQLAAAITGKGVPVPEGATLDDFPALVGTIPQGSGGPWKEVEARALWTEVISTAAPAGSYGLVLLQNTAALRFAFPVNNADTIYQYMVMAPGAPGGALSMSMSGAMGGAYSLQDGSGGSVFQWNTSGAYSPPTLASGWSARYFIWQE